MAGMPLKVLDIFSGIGGFSLGLERAGMETVAFCEIEPFCQGTLENHWPRTRIFTDIRILNKELLLKSGVTGINVIAGGFPCQDISCAGKQRGIEGERSGLWKEYKRLIDELRPDYAIIENVANLRCRGLVTVLQDLWQIGYDVQWHCIPASALGAPHRRDRIWLIAYPNSEGNTGLSGGKTKKHSMPRISSQNVSDSDSAGCNCYQGTSAGKNGTDGWQKCAAHPIAGRNNDAGEGFSLHETGSGKETETKELHSSKAVLADTNSAGLQGYRRFEKTRQILSQEAIGMFRCADGIAQWGCEPVIPRLKDERLNPDWVEWLMGFPEGWTVGGTRKQRLVALGNAVVPQIPELIGLAIINHYSNYVTETI